MAHRDPLAQLSGWFAPLDVPAQPRSMPVPSHLHQQLSPRPATRDSFPRSHEVRDNPQSRTHDRSQLLGVGMVFQVLEDRSLCVAQIEPNCSAARCGVIEIDDEVLKIDSSNVEKQPISILKETVLGKQGTYVTMTFRRKTPQGPYVYEIELMRGAAEFLEVVTKCKNMAREQAQLINRLRDLEDTVTSQKEEMDKMMQDLQRYDDITSRTQAMQSSAESSLVSAQSEIETARNEIAYLRSAQRNAEDNSQAALRYAQELEGLKAEKEKIESARQKEREARIALGEELESVQRRYAQATLQKDDAERKLAAAVQGAASAEKGQQWQAEIEERFSVLETQLERKVVETQQLQSEKANLEAQLAAAKQDGQSAAEQMSARYEAELAAALGNGSRSSESVRKQQEAEEERDKVSWQLRREQEERAKLVQQSEELRRQLAEEQRKVASQKAEAEAEAGWREEKGRVEVQMQQLQQELLETASRQLRREGDVLRWCEQRDAEEVKAALEQLRAEAAKQGIEGAVREEQLGARLREAETQREAAVAGLEEARAELERTKTGLVEKQRKCAELEDEVQEERAGKELAEKEVEAYKKHLRKVEGELVAARRLSEEHPRQEQEYAAVMAEAEEKVRTQAEELRDQAQELEMLRGQVREGEEARAEAGRVGERASSERQRLATEASRAQQTAAEHQAAAEAAREDVKRVRAELAEEKDARRRLEEAREEGQTAELEEARAEARRSAERARVAEERVEAVAASAEGAREEARRARAEVAEERGARGRAEVEREEQAARVEQLEIAHRARLRALQSGEAALRVEADDVRAENAHLQAQLAALQARLHTAPAPQADIPSPPAPQPPPAETPRPPSPDGVVTRSAAPPSASPSSVSPPAPSKTKVASPPPPESALSHWSPDPKSSAAERDAARRPEPAAVRAGGEDGEGEEEGERSARKSLSLETGEGEGGGAGKGGKDGEGKPKSLLSSYFAQGVRPPTPPPDAAEPDLTPPSSSSSSVAPPAGQLAAALRPQQAALQELRAAQLAAAQRALAGVQAHAALPPPEDAEPRGMLATAGRTPWPMIRHKEQGEGGAARDAVKHALGLGSEEEGGGGEEEEEEAMVVELPGHGVHHAPLAAAIASPPRPLAVLAGHTIAPTPPHSGAHPPSAEEGAADTDPCESFVQKGFRVLGPSDPLDGPFSPAQTLLAASPRRSTLVAKAAARSRSISFDDKANSVLAFVPSVTEFRAEPAPALSPAAMATLMVEAEAEEDEDEEREVKRNTAINAGSAFSFC